MNAIKRNGRMQWVRECPKYGENMHDTKCKCNRHSLQSWNKLKSIENATNSSLMNRTWMQCEMKCNTALKLSSLARLKQACVQYIEIALTKKCCCWLACRLHAKKTILRDNLVQGDNMQLWYHNLCLKSHTSKLLLILINLIIIQSHGIS